MNKQLYVVRKYIMARSAKEAIKLDKKCPVQDIWVDDKWKEQQTLTGNQFGYMACKKKKK